MAKREKHTMRNRLQQLSPKTLLRYDNIVKHLPMILLLGVLAIIYIWNQHSAHRQLRELQSIQKGLKELSWEYATLKKDLNNKSMQTEVSAMVRPLGLQELTVPPVKIKVPHDDQE